MTLFWIIAAGMIILALAFVVPPFLRQRRAQGVTLDQLNLSLIKQQLAELDADLKNGELGQAQYDAARRDLEKELLQDIPAETTDTAPARSGRWAVGIAAIGVPLLSIGLYQALGSPQLIARLQEGGAETGQQAAHPAGGAANKALPSMEVLVERLAQRMNEHPDNIEGWIMLGRSYAAMGRLGDAKRSFETAYAKAPDNPTLLLNYAELLANMQGDRLDGRPTELIRKALEAAPTNPNALWMIGLVEYGNEDYTKAIDHWNRLLAQLPADSKDAAAITKTIDQARSRLTPGSAPPALAAAPTKATKMPASKAAQTETGPAAAGGRIEVRVSLAPELRAQVDENDRIFVFARALKGPRMPLAAVRKQVRDLPLSLVLDDSMAMTPQFVLSSFPQVVVGARISKSGNPLPQTGDLQGQVSPVAPGKAGVIDLVIDSVHP